MYELAEMVRHAVRAIPPGQVATYGDVAELIGCTARQVGRILATDGADIPWWRVVNASGRLPAMVESTLAVPGARLGFVEVEKMVLHDLTGATPIPLEALEGPAPLIEDPYAAFDLVARNDNTALKDLCWAVMVGTVPGFAIQKAPLPHVCSHTADQVFCVDVDPTGVTVMLVGRHETLIAYARFATPATSHLELTAQVDRLMAQATPPDALAG